MELPVRSLRRLERRPGGLAWSLAFLLVMLATLPFAGRGVDFTDFGYHLTTQLETVNRPGEATTPMRIAIFLSNCAGGIWMKLSPLGERSVWWARLGGCLTTAATAGLTALLLVRAAGAGAVAAAGCAVIATLFFLRTPMLYIHYYSFPLLLAAGWLVLLEGCLRPVTTGGRGQYRWAALGVGNGLLVLARVPLVTLAALPVLLLLVRNRLPGETPVPMRRLGPWAAGLAATLGIGIAAYAALGVFQNIDPLFAPENNLVQRLISIQGYALGFGELLPTGATMLVLFVLMAAMSRDAAGRWVPPVFVLAVGATILVTLYPLHEYPRELDQAIGQWTHLRYALFVPMLCILFVPEERLLYLADGDGARSLPRFRVLALGVCLTAVLFFLGSGSGLQRFGSGLTVLGALALYPTLRLWWTTRNHLWAPALAAVLLGHAAFVFAYVNELDAASSRLTVPFASEALRGMRSSKERTAAVDRLLEMLGEHVKAGDRMLVLNKAPLVHVLAGTRPAYASNWLLRLPLSHIRRIVEERDRPETVLIVEHMPHYAWPAPEGGPQHHIEDYRAKLNWIESHLLQPDAYERVYRDDDFRLYRQRSP